MINFEDVGKSRKFTWVNRYCESAGIHWCARLVSLLSKVGRAFLFQCNFDLKLLNLNNLPLFYKNILKVWQELNFKEPLNANEFKQEFLWNNRFIKTNGRTIYYKTWVNKDILKISYLHDNQDQFLSFESFKRRKFSVRCTFLDYAGVLAAIPKAWKNQITSNIVCGV